MPFYHFRNKTTGEQYEKLMSISAREQYLQANPEIETMIAGAPGLSDPVRLGLRKPDEGFRDLLGHIRKNNIWSKMNTHK